MFDIFLLVLALIWLVVAALQDVRTTEIADWLTLSLLVFALSYRAIYALMFDQASFFTNGLVGVFFFAALAYLLYYGHVFAGGDAKLLVGLGAVFPIVDMASLVFSGIGFVVLMLGAGTIYTILYSSFVCFFVQKQRTFYSSFRKSLHEYRLLVSLFVLCGVVSCIMLSATSLIMGLGFFFAFIVFGLLIPYMRTLERISFIKLTLPQHLRLGDWLVSDVRVGKKTIKATVHGLSAEDIALLRKAKKSVIVRNGVPFAPSFVLAFVLFVLFF